MSEKRARLKRQQQGNGDLPAQAAIRVKAEHTDPLLRSMIAEGVLGYEKRLNQTTGAWEWKGEHPITKEKSGWVEVDGLPPVSENDNLASLMWTTLCEEQGIIGAIKFNPKSQDSGKRWTAHFFREVLGKEPQNIGSGSSDTFARAICSAITGLYNMNLATAHKALFPMEYMAVQ